MFQSFDIFSCKQTSEALFVLIVHLFLEIHILPYTIIKRVFLKKILYYILYTTEFVGWYIRYIMICDSVFLVENNVVVVLILDG